MDPEQEHAGKPDDDRERQITLSAASASGSDLKGQTLLPMLIAGLILIVVGMLAVLFLV